VSLVPGLDPAPGNLFADRRVVPAVKTPRFSIVVAALAATLVGCASGASQGPTPPAGGVVSGQLVSQRSDGSHRVPEAGEKIGVFKQAFPAGGPIMADPPSPVATAVTSSDGTFSMSGLRAGRYFVTIAKQGIAVEGAWVRVTADRGAPVVLVLCTDCVVPL
jgi:hypothetical protein